MKSSSSSELKSLFFLPTAPPCRLHSTGWGEHTKANSFGDKYRGQRVQAQPRDAVRRRCLHLASSGTSHCRGWGQPSGGWLWAGSTSLSPGCSLPWLALSSSQAGEPSTSRAPSPLSVSSWASSSIRSTSAWQENGEGAGSGSGQPGPHRSSTQEPGGAVSPCCPGPTPALHPIPAGSPPRHTPACRPREHQVQSPTRDVPRTPGLFPWNPHLPPRCSSALH